LQRERGVISSLRDVVQIREEALPAIAPFMQSAVLVENMESAQGLIQRYPDYQFVTVQGDVILSPTLYAGGAKTEDVPGLMAIQRHRKELDSELEMVNQQIQGLEEQVRTIQERLDVSNHEMVRITEVRESKNKDLLMEQMSADQIEKEKAREEKLLEILSQEILQLRNEREAVHARFEEFTRQLEVETERRQEREQAFQEIERKSTQAKEAQQSYQNRVNESRVQIAELKERDRSLLAELERLKHHLEEIQNTEIESQLIIEERQREIQSTNSDCGEIESLLVEMLRNRDLQKTQIEESQKKKESLGMEIGDQENRVREAQGTLDLARENRSNTEITKTRIETQKEDLLSRCREEMGIELESLPLPESEINQLGDEELKNKLAETEMKIERLGSINALALEEYVQLEERHRFLKTQYDDLKISIDTLLETIQRIDVTSLQRFREAFVKVQTHFQDLFQRLFNGGKCEMVLVDPENPGESGIDIHVQPPGKRLQNMNLLSGGEKTLTGVAFLMALFQYHTSPICVMDEVDAALDEVNVQRFASLISEMKKQIQFIIVTHNKRTMEAADQLYGVTMGEPGVSSVLSAKFDEAEALIAS
jgi:chromosome segregation protein